MSQLSRMAGLACVGVVVGCVGPFARPRAIGGLLDSAATYDGQRVTVSGTVENPIKLPLVESRFYQLRDSTGAIPVVAYDGRLPVAGTKATVTGTLRVTAILGTETLGPHIAVGEATVRP